MLEGKYWKNGVPKVVKLTLSRNMSKRKQSKMLEREPKKNVEEKWIEKKPKEKKRVEMKMKKSKEGRPKQNWSLTQWKMILGLITLKHSLGLLILSFGTPNLGLHYVL